ncbi:MAG: transposase [Bacteroidales bacterium]|nr:transposase [Bacteroidales bacterium]
MDKSTHFSLERYTKRLNIWGYLAMMLYVVIMRFDLLREITASMLTNDMGSDHEEIVAIYRKRWEIELMFNQIKQNLPLKYFYGESANAIKI